MKNKVSITKSIAALLCIITMAISFNIYLSYKGIYVSDNLPKDSIVYIAAAKTSINNSNFSTTDTALSSIKAEEINNNISVIDPNKENVHKKIFINILMLFLSFISLSSVHNYVLNVEKAKEYNSNNKRGVALNKNTNIKSPSSAVAKEGVK